MLLVDIRVDRVLVILKRCVFLNNDVGGILTWLAGPHTCFSFLFHFSFFFSH